MKGCKAVIRKLNRDKLKFKEEKEFSIQSRDSGKKKTHPEIYKKKEKIHCACNRITILILLSYNAFHTQSINGFGTRQFFAFFNTSGKITLAFL